ncbi:MAG: WecB/TagA/CpsF family glycosyltransferase [Anaerolineae bacterium]|nr:WecB/TagA/CpsF family glycosyltransferase [Anaerolineae bacterium]
MRERTLIVQLGDIGDLVLTTPALEALREARPDAHLTLLAMSHTVPVLAGTQLVDEIVTLDRQQFNNSTAILKPANLRRLAAIGHHDTVIYCHHFTLKAGTLKFALIAWAVRARRRIGLENGNGWFLTDRLPDGGFGARHQAQYWLDLVGLLGADSRPRPAITCREDDDLIPPTSRPTVIIHAGSGGYSRARRWDPASFATVADTLAQQANAQIVLVGGKDDDSAEVKRLMQTSPIDLINQTSLPQLAGVIAKADLFIGADSGVTHVAAAVGTPVIAIFGPSNAEAYGPWTPDSRSVVLSSHPECSPCSYVDHHIGLREGCPARTCMRMVTPPSVIAAAKAMLNGETVTVPAPPRPARPPHLRILDIPVDAITYDQWLDLIARWCAEPAELERPHHVCTVNPEFIMMAQRDPNFSHILQRADLCVPDGVGLLYASRYLGQPLPQRVTGSDGLPIIAERAAREGWRLFLLGAAPGVAEQAAAELQRRYPGLQIAGTYSGNPTPEEEDEIVEHVNASSAHLLFVAYGAPARDKWIARNLPRLQVNMAMGVGGAFDFIAGLVPRAPLWMQRFGLEWLYRLYLQPWRIKRMTRLPRFVFAVLLRHSRS